MGIKANRGHYCAFCEKVRSLPGGRDACNKSDRSEAVSLALAYREPFFFECHMGLQELIVPLISGDRLLGILFIGQCRSDGNRLPAIRAGAVRLGGDPDELAGLYAALPLVPQKRLQSIGRILSCYFGARILSSELLSPGTSALSVGDLAIAMRSWMDANYKSIRHVREVAAAFYVNPAYASRCFSARFGHTMSEYLTRLRIARACTLLTTTEAPIGSIALNVGFPDSHYFTRVFKKAVGLPPLAYRTKEKG